MKPKSIVITTLLALIYSLIYFLISQDYSNDSFVLVLSVIFSLAPFYIIIIYPAFLIAKNDFKDAFLYRILLAMAIFVFICFSIVNFKIAMVPSILLILIPSLINLFKANRSREFLNIKRTVGASKSFLQRLGFFTLSLLPFILLVLFLPTFVQENSNYRCKACLSKEHTFQNYLQWGVISKKISLGKGRIETIESEAFKSFVDSSHVHQWHFVQSSPYILPFYNWSGCALGNERHPSEFGELFESDSDFREIVFATIKKKEISTQEVKTFLFMPRDKPDKSDAHFENYDLNEKQMKAFIKAFY